MPTYWYASADKLQGLGALDTGISGRLRPKLNLGVAGAGLEVGLDPATIRRLDRAAAKAEAKLRRDGEIAAVAEFSSGPPPAVYFSCRGPACRAVVAGMFWAAAADNGTAVLLVGSAANAIAAKRSAPDDVFSPSADPVGAVRYLLADSPERPEARSPDRAGEAAASERAGDLAHAWRALFNRDLAVAGYDIDALPRALSVAQYATRCRISDAGDGWQSGIRWLVLGSPLYVAQSR